MSKIIDINAELELKKRRAQCMRLIGMIEASEDAVNCDPWPVIDFLGERMVHYRMALEKLNDICNGRIESIDYQPIYALDPMADYYTRMQAIRTVLDQVLGFNQPEEPKL